MNLSFGIYASRHRLNGTTSARVRLSTQSGSTSTEWSTSDVFAKSLAGPRSGDKDRVERDGGRDDTPAVGQSSSARR